MSNDARPAAASRRNSHEARVLELLRRQGAPNRAQIGEALGLSRVTISAISGGLLASGQVVRQAPGPGSGVGRTPELLALNPSSGHLIGVELGHTRVSVVASGTGLPLSRFAPDASGANRVAGSKRRVRGAHGEYGERTARKGSPVVRSRRPPIP